MKKLLDLSEGKVAKVGILKMKNSWRSGRALSGAIGILLGAASLEAVAGTSCYSPTSDEVSFALSSYGSHVVAVGRVDSVDRDSGIQVLGLRVTPSAGDYFQVGDYAIVIDWARRGSKYQLLEVRRLNGRYIPGVSEVYLKAKLSSHDALQGRATFGSVKVDYSVAAAPLGHRGVRTDQVWEVRGTQPQPNGIILSSCAAVRLDGSLGTGRTEGSLGTGRTEGSLGTGRTEGSLGTGRITGSLGTGRTEGSLGTGRTEGSLGTGRITGSLGTGRTEGSLGTGRITGSLGTGRTEGSLGTGRTEGSLGTGRTEGSLGTGRITGSLGTGRTEGPLGTGRTEGSLGTGSTSD